MPGKHVNSQFTNIVRTYHFQLSHYFFSIGICYNNITFYTILCVSNPIIYHIMYKRGGFYELSINWKKDSGKEKEEKYFSKGNGTVS